MEEFREKVKNRFKIYNLICISGLALYFVLNRLTKGAGDFAQGLTMGVFCGSELVAVYNLARSLAALRNEEKLKEMYIQETDERNAAIQKETSQKSSAISIFITAMAALAAGFFDEKICLVLASVLLVNALIYISVNMYFRQKM